MCDDENRVHHIVTIFLSFIWLTNTQTDRQFCTCKIKVYIIALISGTATVKQIGEATMLCQYTFLRASMITYTVLLTCIHMISHQYDKSVTGMMSGSACIRWILWAHLIKCATFSIGTILINAHQFTCRKIPSVITNKIIQSSKIDNSWN